MSFLGGEKKHDINIGYNNIMILLFINWKGDFANNISCQ
jgi:hypothetical protein